MLSAETLACFYGARDFKLFVQYYATEWESMGNAFEKNIQDDFQGYHRRFSSLKETYLKKDTQSVAK